MSAPPTDIEPDILATGDAGGAAIRGGVLRTTGFVVNAVLGALSAAVLFRHLGVENTGVYVTAMSLITIVAGLSDLGLTAVGIREVSVRPPAERRRLMADLLGLRLVAAVGGVGVMTAFAAAVGYAPVLIAGVAVAGVGIVLQSLQSTLAVPLMTSLRLGWVTITEVARQAALTVLIVVLVIAAHGAGVLAFLALQIPVGLVILGLTAALVRADSPLRPSFHGRAWRPFVRDLLPYSLASALAIIYFRVSVIAVSLTASAEQLGYFSTSFRIIEVLITIPGLIVSAAFPIFSHAALGDRERLSYAVGRVFQVSLILGAWFSMTLAIGAPVAIDIVGGSAFREAAGVLVLQALGLGGSFVSTVWGMVLISLQRRRELLLLTGGALVAGALLVALLCSLYGARGAALGTAITEIGLAVFVPVVVVRAGVRLRPYLRTVPAVALAAAAATAVLLVPGSAPVLEVLAASVVYFAALAALRALPPELAAELRRLRAR